MEKFLLYSATFRVEAQTVGCPRSTCSTIGVLSIAMEFYFQAHFDKGSHFPFVSFLMEISDAKQEVEATAGDK